MKNCRKESFIRRLYMNKTGHHQCFAKTEKKLSSPKRQLEAFSRGSKAEEAYKEVLKKGKVQVYRARIMLVGQARAGKTSLKKSLLGLPFDIGQESTVGIKVDPCRMEVEVDQVKNWQRLDVKKSGLSAEYAEDIPKDSGRTESIRKQGYAVPRQHSQ